MDGIIVSNHGKSPFYLSIFFQLTTLVLGGRQIDGAIPSLYALDMIMQSPAIKEAQRSDKLTVLFDSGIRTGSDIIKALALGAQGILRAFPFLAVSKVDQPNTFRVRALVGRPWVYGLAAGGQAGVEQVVTHTLADLDVTLALSGYRSISEVQGRREAVTKVDL